VEPRKVPALTARSCASTTVPSVNTGRTRSRLLRSLGGTLLLAALGPRTALARDRRARARLTLSARNAGRRYAGDRALFATVSPGVRGQDTAAVRFGLNRTSRVTLEAVRTALRRSVVVWGASATLQPGQHELSWTPESETPVGSYVMRLTIAGHGGRPTVLGGRRPASVERQQAAVVRVLGVEAGFLRRSYAPGEAMELRVLADAPALSLQFLRCGAETEGTNRSDELKGAPMGDPVPLDWSGKRSGSVTITVQTGDWPTGFYAARLTTDDGRVGFAPFVLRPSVLGKARQLVVLPTNTWQVAHRSSSTAPTATAVSRRASSATTWVS
jgi:hypothetical protein